MKISDTELSDARLGASNVNTISIGSQLVWGRIPSFPTQTFTPEAYGAVGDGIADDTNALLAMRAAIWAAQDAAPDLRTVIQLTQNAIYMYTENKWSWGIRYLTIEGNGASIKNTSDSVWASDRFTWVTNSGAVSSNADTNIGFLIDTAQSGDSAVILKDALDASNITVGKWVLVASYTQQNGGWPPNARYCDYVKVLSISGATINLDRPLVHRHRDDWPTRGNVEEIAEARIKPVEDDYAWAEHWIVRNLTTITNPNYTNNVTTQIEGFNLIEFENVTFPYWVCGQGKQAIFRNSVLGVAELDKMMTLLRIENCTFNFQFGSGLDRIEVIDSICTGIQCMSKELYVEGTTFDVVAAANFYWESMYIGGFVPTMRVDIVGCTFNGPNNGDAPALKSEVVIDKVIGSQGFTLSGSDLIIDQTDPDAWEFSGLMNRIYEGDRVLLADSSGQKRGHGDVVSISSNGAAYTARIVVNWSVAPNAGDRMIQLAIAELYGSNNTMNSVPIIGPTAGIAYMEWNGSITRDLWS